MESALRKLAKKLDGAFRQIHVGMNLNFQNMTWDQDENRIEGTLSYDYSGETNTQTIEITDQTVTVLTIHVVEKAFPFINAVVGFEEFAAKRPQEENISYYKDEQNYVYSGDYRLFTAGLQFVYHGELTEAGLLERIRKTVVFSHEFGAELERMVHKRPKKIRDEQVSENVRYLIIRDALVRSNSIGDKEAVEKEETWDLMNTFTISEAKGKDNGKNEVPVILSFGRKNDEMAAEVLIDAKKSISIEVYQQGAISLAVQCKAERIDYSDEYIVDEKGTYFKYKIISRHHYESDEIERFIRNMAKVAANLVQKIS